MSNGCDDAEKAPEGVPSQVSQSTVVYIDEYHHRMKSGLWPTEEGRAKAAKAKEDPPRGIEKPSKAEFEAALDELDDLIVVAPAIRNWIIKRIAWHKHKNATDPVVRKAQALLAKSGMALEKPDGDEAKEAEDSLIALMINLEFKDLLDYLLLPGAILRSDVGVDEGGEEEDA